MVRSKKTPPARTTGSRREEKEIWRPIPNSACQASSMGRIRRIKDGLVYRHVLIQGYLHVGLHLADRKLLFRVHRLVCMAFHGHKPMRADCCMHINGKKLDNRAQNVRWGTHKENAADSIAHGHQVCGFDHPNVHITKREAVTIHAEYQAHMAQRLAAGYHHAERNFIARLVCMYPHLGYRCVYKACRGRYHDFV